MLRLRDKLLPLLDLAQLLQLEGSRATLERVADKVLLTVVVIQVGARRFGALVDSVFRTEEIVVKPMSSLLRHVGMFSGNTILGDGSVIMIIDPNALGTVVGSVEGQAELASASPAAEVAGRGQDGAAAVSRRLERHESRAAVAHHPPRGNRARRDRALQRRGRRAVPRRLDAAGLRARRDEGPRRQRATRVGVHRGRQAQSVSPSIRSSISSKSGWRSS